MLLQVSDSVAVTDSVSSKGWVQRKPRLRALCIYLNVGIFQSTVWGCVNLGMKMPSTPSLHPVSQSDIVMD